MVATVHRKYRPKIVFITRLLHSPLLYSVDRYKTGNKIDASETGYLKDISEEKPGGTLVQNGAYSYESPEGILVNFEYTADENGFKATGDLIPTPPPVPAEIQKGLDQIYEGIRKRTEQDALRAKSDPEFAKKLQARAEADYRGQYYPL